MSNQSFIKGTVILIIANAISKILGAVFKIPLTYILQEEGMAIFNTASIVYSVILSFVISGFPLAVSNVTAKHFALKNYSYVKRVSNVSLVLLGVLGLIMSLAMFFSAKFLAFAMKDPDAELAIKIISPSIFLVALSTVHKGFFQGSVDMFPTAISQVTESLIRLFVGFLAAYILLDRGIKYSAAGAIFGITFGELLATVFLFCMFLSAEKKLIPKGQCFSKKTALNELLQIAIPMFLCSCILSGLNMIDTSVVRNSLLNIKFTPDTADAFLKHYSGFTNTFSSLPKTLKLDMAGARWLYGAYSGYAITIFNLPAGIIGALSVSILPVITGNLAKNNLSTVKNTASLALLFTNIISFPFALAMFFFSKEVLWLLFKNTASAGLLSALAPCLIFLCIEQLFASLLHAAGLIFGPFVCAMVGLIVKIVCDFVLIQNPHLNIYGAPISAGIAYFVIMLLYIFLIKKHLNFKFCIKDSFIKPMFSSVLMIGFMLFIITPLKHFLGDNLGFIVAGVLSVFVYIILLLMTNCLPYELFKKN